MRRRQTLSNSLRTAPILLGLLCFAAIVWVAGPLLAYGDTHPLDPAWLRAVVIAIAVILAVAFYGFRQLRRLSAAKAIEHALSSKDEEGSDGALLAKRMSEAIDRLKRSSGKRAFLYELPWYLIIGPSGAGKTTALVNSGLKFPLAGDDEAEAVAGVGGTRHCDFWFTDDAVLIDTAGRYTTHDSDSETDRKSWLSFLSLLKTNRPRQPVNGVIVAISVADILTLPAEELAAHGNAIRRRLLELQQELKIVFPVYALFTKADLIEGFREYFGNFNESRRRKVWGATFQTQDRKQNMVAQVPAEFDALVKRLTEDLSDRLSEEPDATSRIAIFGFPAQVAAIRDRAAEFLARIFETTRNQTNANLRGFYFSSGTQEGTPIDQLLGAMGRNLAVAVDHQNLSGRGKSFFLHDLLQLVIFEESGWVSIDRRAMRRATLLRYGGIAAIACVSALCLGAIGWSYVNNKSLIASVSSSIDEYRIGAGDELSRAEISTAEPITGNDFTFVALLLGELRNMPVGYAHHAEPTPIGEAFGLGQREALHSASAVTYRNALERMLRSRLILRLEQQIRGSMDDPALVYEALKIYLMLGGKAPKAEDSSVVGWIMQDWETNVLPGKGNEETRHELAENLRNMLELGRSHGSTFELDGKLVAEAQASLARLTLANRAYLLIRTSAYLAGLQDTGIVHLAGADAEAVFQTRDGTDLSQLKIPGLYTYSGFHNFFRQLEGMADKLESEQWVMGDAEQQGGAEAQFDLLGIELLDQYGKDFIGAWEKVLSNLKLKSVSGDKPDFLVLAEASEEATSPIRRLLESIRAETALTESRGDAQIPTSSDGLSRIGIDLGGKSQVRPGEAGTNSKPGANIEAYFKFYHNWVEGNPGSRPVDVLLNNLYEVRKSLLVIANYPSQSGPANEKLQLQVVSLRGTISRLPKPFATMVSEVVEELEGAGASGSKSQLNQALATKVTKFCLQVVDRKYPFSRDAESDTPMDDFAQLFGPGGLMEKFFAEHLASIADMSGDVWEWQKDTPLGRALSPDTLLQFQRAAEIRTAFFPNGGSVPNVQVTIAPYTISSGAEALLEVNQLVVQTSAAGNTPQTFAWPASGTSGTASISIFPEIAGRDTRIGKEGPWALMRLIDDSSMTHEGDDLVTRFVIGGREVSYKIRVGSFYNPLALPALRDFRCADGF